MSVPTKSQYRYVTRMADNVEITGDIKPIRERDGTGPRTLRQEDIVFLLEAFFLRRDLFGSYRRFGFSSDVTPPGGRKIDYTLKIVDGKPVKVSFNSTTTALDVRSLNVATLIALLFPAPDRGWDTVADLNEAGRFTDMIAIPPGTGAWPDSTPDEEISGESRGYLVSRDYHMAFVSLLYSEFSVPFATFMSDAGVDDFTVHGMALDPDGVIDRAFSDVKRLYQGVARRGIIDEKTGAWVRWSDYPDSAVYESDRSDLAKGDIVWDLPGAEPWRYRGLPYAPAPSQDYPMDRLVCLCQLWRDEVKEGATTATLFMDEAEAYGVYVTEYIEDGSVTQISTTVRGACCPDRVKVEVMPYTSGTLRVGDIPGAWPVRCIVVYKVWYVRGKAVKGDIYYDDGTSAAFGREVKYFAASRNVGSWRIPKSMLSADKCRELLSIAGFPTEVNHPTYLVRRECHKVGPDSGSDWVCHRKDGLDDSDDGYNYVHTTSVGVALEDVYFVYEIDDPAQRSTDIHNL